MANVLIIRGYCGTGKTSIAKYIAKKYNFAFLEYDNFLWGMNRTKTLSAFEYQITFKNFLCVFKNYLKTKKTIVIEGPLVPRTANDPFHIKKLISLIKKSKRTYQIVQLVADDAVCVKRMKTRTHPVPKWERDMFRQKHDDFILPDEVIIDTTYLTIKQTITKIEKLLQVKKL